jgi:hypothetical protein
MNLRIADPSGLVAFLHRVISESGEPVLSTGTTEVVSVGGALFYHAKDPVTVGGPFPSVEALVRSEGVRREPRGANVPGTEPCPEIFEWEGSFFRIGGDGAGGVRQYGALEEACDV